MSPGSVAAPPAVGPAAAGSGTPGDSKAGSRSRPCRITLLTRDAAGCNALEVSSGARTGGGEGPSQAVNATKPTRANAGSDRSRLDRNLITGLSAGPRRAVARQSRGCAVAVLPAGQPQPGTTADRRLPRVARGRPRVEQPGSAAPPSDRFSAPKSCFRP